MGASDTDKTWSVNREKSTFLQDFFWLVQMFYKEIALFYWNSLSVITESLVKNPSFTLFKEVVTISVTDFQSEQPDLNEWGIEPV